MWAGATWAGGDVGGGGRERELAGQSGRKRRSRRLFVTTNTDENAIAAPATVGLSSPATANGIAATLYANAQNRLPRIVRSVRAGQPDRIRRQA